MSVQKKPSEVNKRLVIPCYLNFLVGVEALPTLLLPVAAEVVGR